MKGFIRLMALLSITLSLIKCSPGIQLSRQENKAKTIKGASTEIGNPEPSNTQLPPGADDEFGVTPAKSVRQ